MAMLAGGCGGHTAAKHKHIGPRVLFTSSREKKIDRYTDFTLGNGEQRRRFYGMRVAIIIIRFYGLVKWLFLGELGDADDKHGKRSARP